ncbi:DUF2461 domain-containing protein, partial [Bacteroidota bacterium]
TDLRENNTRDWFHANKADYQSAKLKFEEITNILIPEIQKMDSQLVGISAKNSIFRIFRDVRFSKDKSPYKTNMGSFFVKGGRNSGNAGYYLHVEPGSSFLGGGIYMPASDVLKKIRSEIYNFTDEYKKIISNKNFIKNFKDVQGEKLKLSPKGFPKDFTDIELLKFKSYTLMYHIPDDFLQDERYIQNIIKVFKEMKEFNHFLNRAVEIL